MNMSATDILEIYRKNDATIAKKKQKTILISITLLLNLG